MKKKYILFISLVTVIIGDSMAQPTLWASDINPVIGDSYELVSSNYSGSAGASGANVTWDFSQLVGTGTSITSAVSVAPSQYAGLFPGPHIDMLTGDDEVFINCSNGSIIELGKGSPLSHTVFSNRKTIIAYPIAYNSPYSTFTDRYVGIYYGFSTTSYKQGVINATTDSYGTLIIPGGSFTNVMRVHRVNVDSSSNGFGSWSVYTADYYDWYKSGTHVPVLSMGYNGFGDFCTYIYSTVGVTENAAFVSSINLFPNPASLNTSVGYTLNKPGDIKISVIDILGREVVSQIKENQAAGAHQEIIPLADLQKGIYFVQFNNDTQQQATQKLIVN